MINYIISSNQSNVVKNIKDAILKYMMKYDIEERTHILNNLTPNLDNISNKIDGFKVYILDIKAQNDIKIIEYIRNELMDWSSIIIVIAEDPKIKDEIIRKSLYIFEYIEKYSEIDNKLRDSFQKIKLNYDNRGNCLSINFNRIIKRIDYKYIISIEKEKDSKKCNIKTTYGTYTTLGSIKEIFQKLDNRFIKISRSTIANIDQIEEYNEIENIIIFKNRSTTSDVSRAYKKQLIDACSR